MRILFDGVVRVAYGQAYACWHGWAAALPAPPTLWERVEAETSKRREREH